MASTRKHRTRCGFRHVKSLLCIALVSYLFSFLQLSDKSLHDLARSKSRPRGKQGIPSQLHLSNENKPKVVSSIRQRDQRDRSWSPDRRRFVRNARKRDFSRRRDVSRRREVSRPRHRRRRRSESRVRRRTIRASRQRSLRDKRAGYQKDHKTNHNSKWDAKDRDVGGSESCEHGKVIKEDNDRHMKKNKKKSGAQPTAISTHVISNAAELAKLPEEERQMEEMRQLGLPVSFGSTSTMKNKPGNITVQFAENEEARWERDFQKLHRSMHTKTRRKRRSEKDKRKIVFYTPVQHNPFGMD